jgi:5-methylcytosine-specific restriction protein A
MTTGRNRNTGAPHRNRPSGWQRQGKPSASARVSTGAKWKRERAKALRRDAHTCQQCGADATHVDKIKPASLGGDPYDQDNLQSLCPPCHARKTAREAAAASKQSPRRRTPKRATRTHPADVLNNHTRPL